MKNNSSAKANKGKTGFNTPAFRARIQIDRKKQDRKIPNRGYKNYFVKPW